MRKLILIGGSPTAGKSYITKKLTEELRLPWISTDTIREHMRQLVDKKKFPALFLHHKTTPEMGVEFLTTNSAKEIVGIVNQESKDVWKGVKALIETDYTWDTVIIEGCAILPKFIKDLPKEIEIKTIFLIDEDKERTRKSIFERGLWDSARKYPDSVKEKEVEWVMDFNEYIKKEAKKYGFPVVVVGNRKDYFSEIKKLVS